jgi:hypothetical protein
MQLTLVFIILPHCRSSRSAPMSIAMAVTSVNSAPYNTGAVLPAVLNSPILHTLPSQSFLAQSLPAITANMLAKAATKALQIAPIQAVDKPAWTSLFRAYVDFYGASLPETQYQSTFDRLIDPKKDLHCLVLRTPDELGEERKVFGIAHFYPHQTPWSEKPIMHLNGKIMRQRSTSTIPT